MKNIRKITNNKIYKLSDVDLSRLRRSSNSDLGNDPYCWNIVSKDTSNANEQLAIHTALSAFAFQCSGNDKDKVIKNSRGVTLGAAFGQLSEIESSLKRLECLSRANNLKSLSKMINSAVKYLNSRDVYVDCALLAEDMYRFSFNPMKAHVKWAEEYYKSMKRSIDNE